LQVRTFIIFHDCGHQSYTPSSSLHQLLGTILGIFIATPFSWTIRHDTHHATNGCIDNLYEWRYNEHIYYTVQEYRSFPVWKRWAIYLLLTPELFYLWLPFVNFMILERFSVLKCITRHTRQQKQIYLLISEQLIHNIGLAFYWYILYQYGIFYHWCISLWISSNIGVFLFHNQHTFNKPYVVTKNKWTLQHSGLEGSSFIQIPWFLKYFTGGIEYHHIHHLYSRIPGYHLENYHNQHPINGIIKLTLWECFCQLWLCLYDTEQDRYVSFTDI
jgi:omega-6 fatty acid desaturase (delta-12 desaturase)